ncbi:hypothetical protein [Leptospira yanagawae]|uniref:hypothetical protein n=1 Tax=Leptospira yanagawae TaxID=293069 RepID=UPI001AEF46A9|nr:hypothetical protein [Leptospira yanagawae]
MIQRDLTPKGLVSDIQGLFYGKKPIHSQNGLFHPLILLPISPLLKQNGSNR